MALSFKKPIQIVKRIKRKCYLQIGNNHMPYHKILRITDKYKEILIK